MTFGRTTGTKLLEDLPGVATPTGAYTRRCRRRARRRRRRHAMGVVDGDRGTGRLAEAVIPMEVAPLA